MILVIALIVFGPGKIGEKPPVHPYYAEIARYKIPDALLSLFQALPKATIPMDTVRSAVSVLAHFDPDVADDSRAANLRKAERLLAIYPPLRDLVRENRAFVTQAVSWAARQGSGSSST